MISGDTGIYLGFIQADDLRSTTALCLKHLQSYNKYGTGSVMPILYSYRWKVIAADFATNKSHSEGRPRFDSEVCKFSTCRRSSTVRLFQKRRRRVAYQYLKALFEDPVVGYQ